MNEGKNSLKSTYTPDTAWSDVFCETPCIKITNIIEGSYY